MPINLTIRMNETTEIWCPELLMEGSKPCTLLEDTKRESQEELRKLADDYRIEQGQTWSILGKQAVGAEEYTA